ncbi:MAG TPA: hypothetical protein VK507_19145 [Iamia sp.]|nr:hypothetical protein [Iamia sp.]
MEITNTTRPVQPMSWADADAEDHEYAARDAERDAARHPARSHTLSCLAAGRCPAGEPC